MRAAVTAYIGLGANLGDPAAMLRWALARLAELPETELQARSGLYRSAPHETDGPEFVNAVARVATRLTAPALLDALLALELQAGRERPYRYAPRTLDLDLLHYGSAAVRSPRLTLPHPRAHERAFVLRPLAELAPGLVGAAQLAAVADQPIRWWAEA